MLKIIGRDIFSINYEVKTDLELKTVLNQYSIYTVDGNRVNKDLISISTTGIIVLYRSLDAMNAWKDPDDMIFKWDAKAVAIMGLAR